jgi:hypothetical protein
MDSTVKVGLPVFTIHGNHDDPSGADNLSAVDVLSRGKLLNYFGKLARCPAPLCALSPKEQDRVAVVPRNRTVWLSVVQAHLARVQGHAAALPICMPASSVPCTVACMVMDGACGACKRSAFPSHWLRLDSQGLRFGLADMIVYSWPLRISHASAVI